MEKKLKVIVLTATLTCFASSFVSAETIATKTAIQTDSNDKVEQASDSDDLVIKDEFEYNENDDGTITITCYQGDKTEISIPSKIDGKSVTSIGDSAFSGCSSLTSIEIQEGVTSIGASAFNGCSSLTSIEIPDSVTSIKDFAFNGCSSLTSIVIPEGVTSIESYAFAYCSSLTSIVIPEGVTSIGECAFSGCSSLTSIVIPEGVTSIENWVFKDCSSLTSIEIPEKVISIRWGAFYGCSSLTSIEIPDSVTSIGDYAFEYCSRLTIYGEENSYAQEYAKKCNIPFKLSSEYDKDNTITKPEEPGGTVTPPSEAGGNKPETPATKKYTVKFLNEDGTQIGEVQEIEEGKAAIAPANPTKEGYTFKGWDKDFSNVTSDMEVKAIFEKNAEQGKTDKPEEPGGTVTPPSEEGGNEPTKPNPPKSDDGKPNKTSDVASMAGIFTMFAGLIGTIGFKRKRK